MQRCQGQADLDRHTVRHGDDTLVVQEHVSIDFWDTQGHVRSQAKGTTTIDHESTSAHDLWGIRLAGLSIGREQDQVDTAQGLPGEGTHHVALVVEVEARASRASRGQQGQLVQREIPLLKHAQDFFANNTRGTHESYMPGSHSFYLCGPAAAVRSAVQITSPIWVVPT